MPDDALLTRPDLDVVVQRLPPGGATFANSLIAGRSLSEASAAPLDDSADFDIATNIAGLVGAGAFTSFTAGEVS